MLCALRQDLFFVLPFLLEEASLAANQQTFGCWSAKPFCKLISGCFKMNGIDIGSFVKHSIVMLLCVLLSSDYRYVNSIPGC